VATRDGFVSMCPRNPSLVIRTRSNSYMGGSFQMLLGGYSVKVCVRRDRCVVVLGRTFLASGCSRMLKRVKTVGLLSRCERDLWDPQSCSTLLKLCACLCLKLGFEVVTRLSSTLSAFISIVVEVEVLTDL
jgi:hypothetical protein